MYSEPVYPELKGKVAIVTGAGRRGGLGEAIARVLAVNGVQLVLHDIGKSVDSVTPGANVGLSAELEEIAADLRNINGAVHTSCADMRAEAEVAGLVSDAVGTYGHLDIVVNNAGVGYLFGPITEMTQEMWDTVLDVNLRGPFFLIKHAVRQMLTQDVVAGWGRGRIVSIGSRGSKSGSALTSSYIASKHGLVGLTRAAAIELGPQQITVNAVCPNHVTTKLGGWQNQFMARARGQSVEEYLAAMQQRIPLGRTGKPDDTARTCAFLCSSGASFITGEAINVSGGEEMH